MYSMGRRYENNSLQAYRPLVGETPSLLAQVTDIAQTSNKLRMLSIAALTSALAFDD